MAGLLYFNHKQLKKEVRTKHTQSTKQHSTQTRKRQKNDIWVVESGFVNFQTLKTYYNGKNNNTIQW